MRPESFTDMIAEQAAQQQVLLMALRRIAVLTRANGDDPVALSAKWKEVGHEAMDESTFLVAVGHERLVRIKAKAKLDEIIEIGFR